MQKAARVVVGISGGVDSFVTALLLQERGFEVVGVTLQLWGENDLSEIEALYRKRGIPLLYRDGRELLKQAVIAPFVKDYLAGRTPSPCCVCNRYVKWELLRTAAAECGAEHLATGHYVRVALWDGKYYISKGIDAHKDQSYFLWGVPQEILSNIITPLGDFTKAEVKAWAMAHGYEQMAAKKESMGICFLRGRDYREFVLQYNGVAKQHAPGVITDRVGRLIGEHSGLLNYTIGQKQGMPVVNGQAMYVAEIDAERNLIIADHKDGLYTDVVLVGQTQTVCQKELFETDIQMKIRGVGLNPGGYIRIEEWEGNKLKVRLSEPAWAVAPGQPVAFYRGDRLIGGGIAEKIKGLTMISQKINN